MIEKEAPYELCFEVLRRFSKASLLNEFVLIGSWCVYFYKQHYAKAETAYSLRTTDMDFLIPLPPNIHSPAHVQELLADMGFRENFSSHGFMRLIHPELTIDFLVPWKGRGEGKPYLIKSLGIIATPLRFVDLLLLRTIHVRREGVSLRLPHPCCFAFQKLLISGRRQDAGKRIKDRIQALDVLDMVMQQGDEGVANAVFHTLPPKWRKSILRELDRRPIPPGSALLELKSGLTT